MAETRSDQEPSIEEILASIREIISDDDAAAAKGDAIGPDVPMTPAAPAPAPFEFPTAIDADDDILDLAAFAEEPLVMRPRPDMKDPLAGIDLSKSDAMDLSFTDPEEDVAIDIASIPAPTSAPEPEPEPAPEPAPQAAPEPEPIVAAMTPPPVSDIVETDSLLTKTAKDASLDSLTRLAQNIAISRAGNGGTLEDIVREMIRPMLRDWLDRNLPPMIERMVERELERMVKQAMDR